MKCLWVCFCILLTGCASGPVPQASYNVNREKRLADNRGFYHFAGFNYKGPLVNGNPHGKGICGTAGYSNEVPCEFDRGERIDLMYLEITRGRIAEDTVYRKEQAREEAREASISRVRENEQQKANAKANAAAFAQFNQNLNTKAVQLAAEDRKTKQIYDQVREEKQAQYRNEQRKRDIEAEKVRLQRQQAQQQARNQAQRNSQQKEVLASNVVSSGSGGTGGNSAPKTGSVTSGVGGKGNKVPVQPVAKKELLDSAKAGGNSAPKKGSGTSGADSRNNKEPVQPPAKKAFRKVPNPPPQGSTPNGLAKSNGEYKCEDINAYARQYGKDQSRLFDKRMAAPSVSDEKCQTRCDLLAWREQIIKTYRYYGSWSCSVSAVGFWAGVDAGGDYSSYNGGKNGDHCTCVTTGDSPLVFSAKPK